LAEKLGKFPNEVSATLTWPQVYLLLDSMQWNAPLMDDDTPDAPDKKTRPVEALRHQLESYPANMRMPQDKIDALCERFKADIESGARVWSEDGQNWVDPAKAT
jgi:hypothetical protein